MLPKGAQSVTLEICPKLNKIKDALAQENSKGIINMEIVMKVIAKTV